jgi:DNA sulfur modification protein DndD
VRVHSVISPEAWRFVAAAGAEAGLGGESIATLLEAGLQHGGEANRRRLFAALDRLLDGEPISAETPVAEVEAGAPARVQLRSVEARNWSVYRHLKLDLPEFTSEQPLVLIGGKNGAGKTSLLTALVFGLFGYLSVRDVFAGVDRAGRMRSAYRRRVESLLHRPARDRGDLAMSVALSFDTATGPLRIERRWFLSADGKFEDEDEELILQVGPDRDLLPVPPGADPTAHLQAEITRRLLPPTLAPFLFFDGEQVERLGGRRLEEQLRLGVESILGASYLRAAAADLRDYARDRIRDVGPNRGEADASIHAEVGDLEAQERDLLERLERVQGAIRDARSERDRVMTELGRLSGDTYAALQDLLEQQRRTEGDTARFKATIAQFAAEDLPVFLAGVALRDQLCDRLEEEESAGALAAAQGADLTIDRFFEVLVSKTRPSSLTVTPELAARVRDAWVRWKAERAAVDIRHHYLIGRTREVVRTRLRNAESAREHGRTLLNELSRCTTASLDLERRIREQHGRSEDQERFQGSLGELTGNLEALDSERQALQRSIDQVRSALEPKREQLRASLAMQGAGLPATRRARRADELADLLLQIADRAAAAYSSELSAALTRSFRELAHKELIAEIAVGADGRIRVTDRAGRAIDDLQASAGERHVFAIALMAAIAELGGASLPVVMDTPLGRLDREHRERILQYCMARRSQTILLSHTEEIGDRYLAQIEDRIAARFLLEHRPDPGGPGESVVTKGYFAAAGVR